jgi:hypothetical protein
MADTITANHTVAIEDLEYPVPPHSRAASLTAAARAALRNAGRDEGIFLPIEQKDVVIDLSKPVPRLHDQFAELDARNYLRRSLRGTEGSNPLPPAASRTNSESGRRRTSIRHHRTVHAVEVYGAAGSGPRP